MYLLDAEYKGYNIRTDQDLIFLRMTDMIIYFLLRLRTLIIRDLLKSSPLLVTDLVTTLKLLLMTDVFLVLPPALDMTPT